MTRQSVLFAVALVAGACGAPGQGSPIGQNRLALVAPNALDIADGQQVVIIFAVINARGPVTYRTSALPSFGSFDVDRLVLSPRHLVDAGDYAITVSVTDGTATDEREIPIHVSRPFTEPYLAPLFSMSGCPHWYGNTSPPGTWVENYAQDADGDTVKLEFEVVPDGASFTGAITQDTPLLPIGSTLGGAPAIPSAAHFKVQLTGLTTGSWYLGRHRATDATGQSSAWVLLCDGRPFQALP